MGTIDREGQGANDHSSVVRGRPRTASRGGRVFRPDLVPTAEVQARVEAQMLRRNRLGDAFGGWLRGEECSVTAAAMSIKTDNWARNKRRTIEALLEGFIPTAPSCRKAVQKDLRGLAGRAGAEGDSVALGHILLVLEAVGESPAQLERLRRCAPVVPLGCVYVAILETYWQLASLCKVGHTGGSRDPEKRVGELRSTGAPEAHLVVRVYLPPAGMSAAQLERRIHLELRKLGATWRLEGAGTEWFRSTPQEIDEVAAKLGATRVPARDEAELEALGARVSDVLRIAGLGGTGEGH